MDGFDLTQMFYTLLGFNLTSFTLVSIITNILLPFIVVWYAMYLLLCRLRILRNETINKVIGAFMAFLSIRLGVLAMWLGFAGVLVLKFDNFYDKMLSIIIFFLLISQIASIFSVRGALAIACLGISLACILKMSSKMMKTIAVIIIFVVYYFALPYAAIADTQFRLMI